MTIKTIIFDLDGTLVNSIEDIADAMNYTLAQNNFPTHSYKSYENFIGNGIGSLVEKAVPNFCDAKTIHSMYQEMFAYYSEHCTQKTTPYPSVIANLRILKNKGVQLGVLSNKIDVLTKQVVKKILPDVFFDVRGMQNEQSKKPNPSQLLTMCNSLNTAMEEVLFVGDSIVDLDTAKNAGVKSVAVSWGYKSKEDLAKEKPDFIIDDFSELLTILNQFTLG